MSKKYNQIERIRNLFPQLLQKKLPKEITVFSVGLKTSKDLNSLYRKKNKSTNVLSFRYSRDYGEILLCPEVIKREARLAGNPQKYQMTWMIVHGMIHLAGMHHEKSKNVAARVEKLEKGILGKIFPK